EKTFFLSWISKMYITHGATSMTFCINRRLRSIVSLATLCSPMSRITFATPLLPWLIVQSGDYWHRTDTRLRVLALIFTAPFRSPNLQLVPKPGRRGTVRRIEDRERMSNDLPPL